MNYYGLHLTWLLGDNLEPQLGSLFAESVLRSFDHFLVVAQKHALVVRLFGSKHVIQDSRQLVRRCGYSFCRAEFATHPTKELSKVVVGVIETMRTQPKRISDSVFDGSSLCV